MSDPSQWMILLRTILALGAVIGLIFALSWVAKKYLNPEKWVGAGVTGIKVLRTFAIEPKKKLMVVEVENRKILLGVAETSISFLCDIDSVSHQVRGDEEVQRVEVSH